MNCQTVEKQLSAWLDGELDAAASEEVRAHIRGCPRCRAKAGALDQAAGYVRDLPRVAAPADFLEKFRQRLAFEPAWKRLFRRIFRPFHIKIPVELAAAAVVGMLLFFVIMPGGQKEQRIAGTEETGRPAPIRLAWAASDQPPIKAFNAPRAMESDASRDSAVRRQSGDPPVSAEKAPQEDRARTEAKRPAAPAEKSAQPSAQPPAQPLGRTLAGQPASGESYALFRIRRVVEARGGNIRKVRRNDAGRPVSVRVEIPSAGYAELIDRLSRSGEFLSPPPVLSEQQMKGREGLDLMIRMK